MGNSINLKDFIENISYNKNQTYTRVEVLDEISKFELLTIVNTLPTENIKTNKIYLVLNNKPTGNESVNRYDLYVYVNNKWEQIDSLELNIDDYYTKLNIDNLLDSKADYNHTHGLTTSSTDGFMSHYDKNKLDNIEDEANKTIVDNTLNDTSSNPVENNVINTALGTKIDKESITDNLETNNSNNVLSAKQGKVLKDLVDNKTNIGHPHSASDVTDNSAYTNIGSSANSTQKAINNSINTKLGLKADSSDVYTKSETYTRTEIMSEIVNQISNITLFTVVTELPTTNIKPNKFYLVNNNKNKTENVYDIYVYVNNNWEKIDSLEFNLDDYYTKTETDTLLDGKVDTTDSRLTDSRNPKSHSHGNISNTGAIGSSARKPLITTTNGVVTTGEFGNSAGTFVEGNDSRLSDARTPVSHTHSKEEITDFPTSMTPSAHTHGAIQNGGTLNSDTASANKVVVTDSSNNIKTVSKLPLDKVTHQDISGKAESNHTHGAVQNNGTLNNDTDSVNKIVVTDNNNNIKTISKLPNANITEQDITGKVDKSDIQDNLTSTDGDKPLSANQGKILKGLVDGKANTTHSHNTGEVTDTSAYGNIGSSANSTQKTINNNINTKLGLKANTNDVYTKTQTLTATEITTAIAEGVSNVSLFEVVTTLPTTNIKGNKFYLKSNNENNTENLYDIYIYVNNKWEKIDSLEFDIDNYYTITQIDNLLNGKVNTTDSRLTDSRTPKSHSHGNITNTGAVGSTANKPLITTTNGVVTTGEFGTTANTFVQGNDSRLSNARTPTSHTHGAIQNGGTINSDTTTVGKVVVTDGSNNIKTISKLPSANVTHQDISGKVNTSDVKDNLTSTDTNKPLSAKQGKVLDEKISNIVNGNVDLSSNHQHDDRYYTESEIDTKLNSKVNTSDSRLTNARTPKFNLITASTSNIVDLDTYKTGGFYYTNSDANYAKYIIHCPWSNGTATPYTGNKSFFLLVETWGTTSNYVKQTLTYYTNNTTFTRTCSNGTWTSWKEHNTNNNDYLRLSTRIVSGESAQIPANNIIGGGTDSKYHIVKSGVVLDPKYPILFNTSAIATNSYTDNVYVSHTGVPLTNNVSGLTVTNQKQVYIEGTSFDGRQFVVSDRVFVSDDQINSTTDLGKYYIYIGVSYSTTNIRFNSFHQTVYVETRNGLVPVGDNTHNPHMLVKSNVGTAGYFKFLTIRTIGTYHDQTIEFDTTHRGNKPKTVVSFNFNTYEKTSGSKQYYTNIQAFYYHGYPTPIYYIQTNDGVQDATFDFYIRRETWDEMGVSDLRSSTNNYNGMTVTWHNDFVTALPTGTTQATLNPYYAQVGHTHGSIANNGQLNSDTTSVNKVVVTDSSNNLKTINQLPYNKISGTPTSMTPTAHNQASSTITEASALGNLGTSANATQATINSKINEKIGTLSSIKAIEVVASKPTASASTMNKLYIVSENSKVNVYYTKQSGSTYTLEKMDEDILDELSIAWNDITGKPSTFTPTSHTHGNITNAGAIGSTANLPVITGTNGVLQASSFGTGANTFCQGNDSRLSNARTPTAHTDSNGAYGKATGSVFGHTKLSDNYTSSAGNASQGIGASSQAVKSVYDIANGKSTVSVKQTKTSGIEIGSVTVNGTETKLYQQDNNTTYTAESTATNIKMNGTQSAGSLATYARGDHVHPSDTKHSQTNIPANANLNSYVTAGWYHNNSNADVKTMTNTPWTEANNVNGSLAFAMEVLYTYGVVQIMYTYNDYNIYFRRSGNPSNNGWTAWKKIYNSGNLTKADITALGIPASDTNTTYSKGNGLLLSGTTFSVDFGSSTDTGSAKVVACNDSRLSNARTPTSHTHGALQNNGTVNSDVTSANMNRLVVTDGSNNIKTAICTYTNGKLNFGSG